MGEPSIQVLLSPGLRDRAGSLREELGPRFAMSIGAPAGDAVAELLVIDAADPAGIAEIRQAHPHTGLVVVLSASRRHVRLEVLYDAGADVVLARPDSRVLAAHVRAVARSYGW